jgi:hypothetical protein
MKEIPLSGRRGEGLVALVDDEDAALVEGYHWNLHSQGYAVAKGRCYMHVLIMGAKGVDHIDGDPLNNQRSNLRFANQAQNMQNRAYGYGSSQYRGVTWYRGKWQAQAKIKGVYHYLGRYADEAQAARVAAEFRAKHMPYSTEGSGDPDAPSLYHVRVERTAA